MDPGTIELMRQIYEIVRVPATKAVITKGIELFERPLVDVFPLFGRLGAVRIRQLERSVHRLEDQLRQVEITHDAERVLGFANMCFRYFEAGAKEHREIKLKMLAAACAHCADASNLDPFDVELEVFDAIERLQPFHLLILRYLDDRHTQPKAGGGHEHLYTCTFDELLALPCADCPNQEAWLSKAILSLHEMAAVRVVGGTSIGRTNGGRWAPVVEPSLVVRSGKLGLDVFGCKLLKYVKNALDADVAHPYAQLEP